ncbi:MAG: DUF2817 domain-containing protein [Clostridiales bacterium]|nr:DUF2817 domain-containing protein [Clostridiales bacterium]
MINWLIKQTIDLSKGIKAQPGTAVRALMTPGDHLGHTWQVTCLKDGAPQPLTGSVAGHFMRADDSVVTVQGSLGEALARVTLPQECYAVPGLLDGVLRLTQQDGTKVTLARETFLVGSDVTDGALVDPGDVIPTIDDLLARMDALTALTAQARALTEAYDGTVLGMARDQYGGVTDPASLAWESGSFAAADGRAQGNAAYIRTAGFLPVRRGSTVTVADMARYRFQCMWYASADEQGYDPDRSKAAAALTPYTVPRDGYLRISIRDTEQASLFDCAIADRLVLDLIGGTDIAALRARLDEQEDALLEAGCAGMDMLDPSTLGWLADTGLTEAGELTQRAGRVSVDGFIACAKGSRIRLADRRFLLDVSAYSRPASGAQIEYTGYRDRDWTAAQRCFIRVSVRRATGLPLTAADAMQALSFRIYGGGADDPAFERGTIITATGEDADSPLPRMRTARGIRLRQGARITAAADLPFYVRLYDDEACAAYTGRASEQALTEYTAPRTGWYRFVLPHDFIYNLHVSDAFAISGNGGLSARMDALEGLVSPLSALPIAHVPSAPWRYTGEDIDMSLLPSGAPDRLDTVYGWCEALRAAHPEHVSMEVLGMDASGEHEIRLYTVEAYPSEEHVSLLLASNIHGHERYCLTHTYWLMKTLLERHDHDETMAFLWAHAKLLVIPAVNPWGVKHRRRYNANFVDLNRNYGANWSEGSDTDGTNTWTFGASAGSEPETKAVMHLLSDRPEIAFLINRHDSGFFQDNASVLPAYTVDAMRVDRRVLAPMARALEIEWRRDHKWLAGMHGPNAHRSLFRCNRTSANMGTMDKWANAAGIHGCLLESAVYDVTVDSRRAQDVLRMGLEATVEVLVHALAFSTLLRSNADIEPAYALSGTEGEEDEEA